MPIYEFVCQACGNEIEVLQKISDPHPLDCESCGKAEMKKKVTAAAFRLSGAGWYETDFKEGDKKKNLTEKQDNKASTKSKTDKADDKSADKSNDKVSKKETKAKDTSKAKSTDT